MNTHLLVYVCIEKLYTQYLTYYKLHTCTYKTHCYLLLLRKSVCVCLCDIIHFDVHGVVTHNWYSVDICMVLLPSAPVSSISFLAPWPGTILPHYWTVDVIVTSVHYLPSSSLIPSICNNVSGMYSFTCTCTCVYGEIHLNSKMHTQYPTHYKLHTPDTWPPIHNVLSRCGRESM